MTAFKNLFVSRCGTVSVGAFIGVFAPAFAEVGKSREHRHLRGPFRGTIVSF
jgi:hypothetical protein